MALASTRLSGNFLSSVSSTLVLPWSQYSLLFQAMCSHIVTFKKCIDTNLGLSTRLLPALASCVLSFICASVGFLAVPKKINHKPFNHGIAALFRYIDEESNPWTWDQYMEGYYNPQLWSIALEYRGSMVVFLAVLGLARSRTCVRMGVELAIITHAFVHKRWDVALFMAGMLVAEMDVFVHSSTTLKGIMRRRSTKAFLVAIMIVGVWLSGYPRDSGLESFGYGFLKRVWPHGEYRRRF
jgi:peptidoglycan/LPS O-acetylase OafA/YrhL